MSTHRPRIGYPMVMTLAVLALGVMTAVPGSAQAHRNPATPDSLRQIQSVVPSSGPPGTLVEVSSENLPLQARVHVGVGAIDAGFEALGEAFQGEWGEISASVRIPETATWDRPIYFIAFNAIFSPIGISEPFHVTDADGLVQRTGEITDESPTCVTLRDQDGYLYSLTGDIGTVRPGDSVVVEGAYSVEGTCLGGSTIAVVRLRRAGSIGGPA